jgi:Kef-type K+ transport system membrane component KefB
MISVLIILALGGLMHAARSYSIVDKTGSAGTAMSLGYLLLTAFFTGSLVSKIRLPKLTGYLATGVIVGPAVLNLVPESAIENLSIVSGAAVALIALTAGTELALEEMRPLLRSIARITVVAVGGTMLLLGLAVFLCRPLLAFTHGMSLAQSILISLVLGVVMVAQSPAVVVALRDEMAADGPVARTVLGVVVISDLVVILMFALVSAAAKSVFGSSADLLGAIRSVSWEVFGSFAAGVLIAGVLVVYIRKVQGGRALFVLTLCFIIAEVGRRLHFDPLLVALTAGVLIRNLTDVGDTLHDGIEEAALPVYVVFFAVAGAAIHLHVLALVGIPAVIFVAVRGTGFLVGTRIGGRLAGAPESVVRYAGFGLLPQAGLALALSMLFARTFPEFGAEARALTLGVVALNELLAPALYRSALVRSGEAGKSVSAATGTMDGVPTS